MVVVLSDSTSSYKEFKKFLAVALQESPPDISEQLKAGLKKRYEKPPVDEIAVCLGRHVPLSKARQMLFDPDEDDMRLYPALIAMPPSGAPDTHPQQKVQVCALASLYLVHSKSWELVRPFVEAGGLRQLAAVLAHTNPYLASQAMSALLHITDEGLLFPWHDPPPTPDGRGPRQGPYARVWRNMFDLSRGGVFLPNLLAHYRQPPAFPGASYMALRLFAFYVSWMRKHFTQDGRLSLSVSLLSLLHQWSADEQEPPSLANSGDASATSTSTLPVHQHHLGGLTADDEPVVSVVSERTEINSGPSTDNEAEVLKEQGNEAYRRGDYSLAIQLYSAALDVLVPAERLLTEGPRRAAYHANRAAAYMARAASGKLREGDADTTGHLEGVDHGSEGALSRHYEAAVMDCDQALALQPSGRPAAKALLRKSRALLQLRQRDEAMAAARRGLGKCEGEEGGVRGELQEALRAAQQQQQRPPPPQQQPKARAAEQQGMGKAQLAPEVKVEEFRSGEAASKQEAPKPGPASKPTVVATHPAPSSGVKASGAGVAVVAIDGELYRNGSSNGGGAAGIDWNAMD
ncbi:hypothetical protein VOLCADRAFT_90467 [Volvox carteri f. nagariensis]|uniref:Uncharacterized protein n=1 Tax=Volvox carteri f. nagariensis TaxID=3068 RepID=D8TUG3_VOLCA|nr:uncharacterized protein VOLCADRAFT_90467 [Volvox carteri f. nagariensis]EFJ48820.1 hypothetical protein VOLCADRAFT_90467 [Volvox carteri f. nagariensis]|eukprot:XP_002950152.1 hypothetical protein VOLCADRAFT_90467 [Volvox carteri f. nagariensis]